MPRYEYRCTSCDETVELPTRGETDCPGCAGPLRRIFSVAGIHLRGAGFYRNDSRSNTSSVE